MLNGWVPNETPWVDRMVNSVWDRLAAAVPEDMLPTTRPGKGKKRVALEFGCGHYGCVLPVGRPRTVLKITSDSTEARFVSILPTLVDGGELGGLVEYQQIFAVSDSSRRGRPIFFIWREEAHDVGRVVQFSPERAVDESAKDRARARTFLFNYLDGAREVRNYIDEGKPGWEKRRDKVGERWAYADRVVRAKAGYGWRETAPSHIKNPERAAVAVAFCLRQAENLQSTSALMYVGHVLSFLIYSNILLADVHLNNIGLVDRPDYDEPIAVITDPGHMVPLDASVQPQPIPGL